MVGGWHLTQLGDLALLAPMSVAILLWVHAADRVLAWRWFGTLMIMMAITVATKVFYSRTDYEFGPLHFRVVSGHLLLSFGVWPVAAFLVFTAWWPRLAKPMCALAACICVGIGFARLDGSHTLSEVIVGSAMGIVVAARFLRDWTRHPPVLRYRAFATVALAAIFLLCYGNTADTLRWVTYLAYWSHWITG